jgi:hypothetical protein
MTSGSLSVAPSIMTTTEKNSTNDDANLLDPATGLTPADLRRAALTVCGYATDADDARTLLEALGLTEGLRTTALAS